MVQQENTLIWKMWGCCVNLEAEKPDCGEKRINRCTKEKEKRLCGENKNVKQNEKERGGGVRTVPATY